MSKNRRRSPCDRVLFRSWCAGQAANGLGSRAERCPTGTGIWLWLWL